MWDESHNLTLRQRASFRSFNDYMRKRNQGEDITESMSREMTGELIAGGHDPEWSVQHVAKRMKQAQERDLERHLQQQYGGQFPQFDEHNWEVGQSNGHIARQFEASCSFVCLFDNDFRIDLPLIVLKSHQSLKEQLVVHLNYYHGILQEHGYWREDTDAEHRFATEPLLLPRQLCSSEYVLKSSSLFNWKLNCSDTVAYTLHTVSLR
jgi:hypothetical protein